MFVNKCLLLLTSRLERTANNVTKGNRGRVKFQAVDWRSDLSLADGLR